MAAVSGRPDSRPGSRDSLPESPLSETEQRAAAWVERQGVEQTEIDAIATLRPELLAEIATKAVTSFYDAQAVIDDATDGEALAEAARRLDALRAEAAQIEERLDAEIADILDSVAVDVGELPPLPDLPNPLVSGAIGLPS